MTYSVSKKTRKNKIRKSKEKEDIIYNNKTNCQGFFTDLNIWLID